MFEVEKMGSQIEDAGSVFLLVPLVSMFNDFVYLPGCHFVHCMSTDWVWYSPVLTGINSVLPFLFYLSEWWLFGPFEAMLPPPKPPPGVSTVLIHVFKMSVEFSKIQKGVTRELVDWVSPLVVTQPVCNAEGNEFRMDVLIPSFWILVEEEEDASDLDVQTGPFVTIRGSSNSGIDNVEGRCWSMGLTIFCEKWHSEILEDYLYASFIDYSGMQNQVKHAFRTPVQCEILNNPTKLHTSYNTHMSRENRSSLMGLSNNRWTVNKEWRYWLYRVHKTKRSQKKWSSCNQDRKRSRVEDKLCKNHDGIGTDHPNQSSSPGHARTQTRVEK